MFVDANSFVAYVSGAADLTITVHHGHMPDIEIIDEHNATGIWAMFDWVDDPAKGYAMQGYGHYHEDYLKAVDSTWRIKKIHLTRLRVTLVDSAPTVPNPGVARMKGDARTLERHSRAGPRS